MVRDFQRYVAGENVVLGISAASVALLAVALDTVVTYLQLLDPTSGCTP